LIVLGDLIRKPESNKVAEVKLQQFAAASFGDESTFFCLLPKHNSDSQGQFGPRLRKTTSQKCLSFFRHEETSKLVMKTVLITQPYNIK